MNLRAAAGIVASMSNTAVTAFGFVFLKPLSSSKIDVVVADIASQGTVKAKSEMIQEYDNRGVG